MPEPLKTTTSIVDGSVVHLTMRLRGGPSVGFPVIFEAAGRQMQVEVSQNTPIRDAARMALILFEFQGDPDAVDVFSATQRLEPLCTFGYCDIKPDTLLCLVPSRAAAGPDLEPPWRDDDLRQPTSEQDTSEETTCWSLSA